MKRSAVRTGMWAAFLVLLLAIVVLPWLGFSAPAAENFLDAKRDYGCEYGKVCNEGSFCSQNRCIPIMPRPTQDPNPMD